MLATGIVVVSGNGTTTLLEELRDNVGTVGKMGTMVDCRDGTGLAMR